MSHIAAAIEIARKDLRIEQRSRTAIFTALLFAVLVQMIMVFARDSGAVSLEVLAPSVLWITIALASVIALNRAFLLEREHRAIDGILTAPVSRVALFWGKWLANLGFVLTIVLVALPLWVIFFDVELSAGLWGILALTICSAIGITAVGTVFSAMVVRTRFAEMLLPVLMLPFMIPPIFFSSQATVRLLAGRPFSEISGWFRMLLLFDLAFLVLTTMVFPMVVEE